MVEINQHHLVEEEKVKKINKYNTVLLTVHQNCTLIDGSVGRHLIIIHNEHIARFDVMVNYAMLMADGEGLLLFGVDEKM